MEELRQFFHTCQNPIYKRLRLFQIEYHIQRGFTPIKVQKEPLDGPDRWLIHNRLLPLIDILKTMAFDRNFSFFIFAEEPGFLLNTIVSEDDTDCASLQNILKKTIVFAGCSSKYIPWTNQLTLIPDYYTLFSKELVKSPPFQKKKNKVFFSGQISGWPYPFTEDNIMQLPRIHLIEYAQTHPFVKYNVTGAELFESERYTETALIERMKGKYRISPRCDYSEHAKYKYLLSFDGFGAAWGRIVSILFTGSVLLMHSDCKQWFYSWLRPFSGCPVNDANCIWIRKDLSDLEDIFLFLESHPDIAEAIGRNGKAMAKQFLTHEKNREFLRETILFPENSRNSENIPGTFASFEQNIGSDRSS
jgi:hypothetical protein